MTRSSITTGRGNFFKIKTRARYSMSLTNRVILLLIFCMLGTTACSREMRQQPRHDPLEFSAFFPDNRASRDPVPGTVARGQLRDDPLLFMGGAGMEQEGALRDIPGQVGQQGQAGQVGQQGQPAEEAQPVQEGQMAGVDLFPFEVTEEVLWRGQERYDIYCTPCHGHVGDGDGMIVRRGFPAPPSLHIDRLREAPAGHLFDVITNGWGAMPPYNHQISPRDRWTIVAYMRALQLSQNATLDDVPTDERGALQNGGQAP
jgi:mono/diheme cytochrome c family protein